MKEEHKNYPEKIFHKFFINNPSQCLRGAEILGSEVVLHKALKLLSRDFLESKKGRTHGIGRIDIIFRSCSVEYIAEIKYYPYSNNEFWDALKVVGYAAYFNWIKDCQCKYKPAILMPIEKIKLEHQIVAGRLGITLFGITKEQNNFKLKKITDTPIWKQNI